jgi:hypothetical protein
MIAISVSGESVCLGFSDCGFVCSVFLSSATTLAFVSFAIQETIKSNEVVMIL